MANKVFNSVDLSGQLRIIDGKKYVEFKAATRTHTLPIIAKENFRPGDWVNFYGTLNTKNVSGVDGRRHKVWYAEGNLYCGDENVYRNSVVASGTVISKAELRYTPLSNRLICDFVVACGESYFNCIVFGSAAEALHAHKSVGDGIVIDPGMFQSRDYEKNGETRTAYEVLARKFI